MEGEENASLPFCQAIFGIASTYLYLSSLCLYLMGRGDYTRPYNNIAVLVTFIAGTAYLGMSQRLFVQEVDGRPIFCLRYIDWCFSTSLLLLDLALMRGADMKATAVLMGIDVAGELFALMAALSTPDRGKWQYFSLGMLFFGAMVTFLFTVLQRAAEELGGAEQKKFKFVASRTIEVWCLYPVVFTLAEMTNSISQEMEVLGYAILDAIAKSGIPLIIWIWSISEQRASRSKLLTIPENEEYVDA